MKRRVLILSAWYPTATSPISGIFVQDQATILSREYDVAVLVPGLTSWRAVMKRGAGPTSQIEQSAGLSVYRWSTLMFASRIPMLAYWGYIRAARRGFQAVLTSWGKPDVIHAHVVLPSGWAALKLGKEYAIPVVLTEHSGPFSIHLRTGYQRRLVRETLTQVNRVIAVSPALAQHIRAFQSDIHVSIVGNVIKTEFFVPANKGTANLSEPLTRFLSIALLTEQKGLSYLLEAAQHLVQRGISSFELIIGGDGPERSRLERMAHVLGLSNQCRFLGLLTPSDVRQAMQQCDVFVLPSLRETFGVVLGEAMACGKPVISTYCGGPEFVVTPETGILVDVSDSEALAGAMEGFILERFSFNPERIRQSIIERFGETVFLRNISQVYEKVCTKHECVESLESGNLTILN